jgi:hypothetical protein
VSFFFWPLCCLSFFDLPILISPLVSSNASSHPASVLLLLLYSWIVYIGLTITEELVQVQQIHSQNEHKIPSNFSYGVKNIPVTLTVHAENEMLSEHTILFPAFVGVRLCRSSL